MKRTLLLQIIHFIDNLPPQSIALVKIIIVSTLVERVDVNIESVLKYSLTAVLLNAYFSFVFLM